MWNRPAPAPDADERPAALPGWRWSQHWGDVLFLHWRVPPAALQVHLPGSVEVDTLDRDAWASLVVFRLRVRPRGLPFLPGVSGMAEANLRTYVRHRGRTGVWFLSVRVDNRPAAWAARLLTPIPYTHAAVGYRCGDDGFYFSGPDGAAVAFRPAGPAPADPRDDWLVERYRMFAAGRRGLVEARVLHPRWPTREVEVSAAAGPVGRGFGLDLSGAPDRALYSPGVWARFGAFRSADANPTRTAGSPSPVPGAVRPAGI